MDEQSAGRAGHRLGSHRLGPHVVGQRVVVRHLLPDGSATDVLGTCLAWGGTEVLVDRDPRGDDPGGHVHIPVATIVTGKPVPPRASVRNRLTPREVEGHVPSLWPDVEVVPLGDWQLRSGGPYDGRRPRRANSLLAMGDPGRPVPEASQQAVAFYAERGEPALAQAVVGSEQEAALRGVGWRPLDSASAHCQLASVARALRAATSAGDRRPDALASDMDVAREEAGEKGSPQRVTVTLADGRARGRAAINGDWLGLHDLYVDPTHRRQGLATAVLADLLDWGASQGATTAWLHVGTDHSEAIDLYEGLGFVTHHTYGYLGAPTPQ